jgi:8-oxo-dGTP pyrophosphatase MutT (NUDIX family)
MDATKCQPEYSRMTLVGAVHLFLISDQGAILLIRRMNTGYYDGWYSVPAGHIDPGEPATSAIIREAHEEVGIQIELDALKIVHVMHRRSVQTDCANSERVDLFFTTAHWCDEATNCEPGKCDELLWNPKQTLPTNTIPYVRHAYECYKEGIPYSEMGWTGLCPTCGSGDVLVGVEGGTDG